jgi:phosphoglycerol transferase MdoB-like AlkP superfamily enzyme
MYQYIDIDGTRELLLGTSNFLIGTFLFASRFLDTDVVVTVLPVVILLGFLGVLWFKQRVTYLRSGYAEPRRLSGYLVGLFAVSLAFSFSNRLLPRDAYLASAGYPLLFGAFLAVTLLLTGQGLSRFYLYAGVALALGVGTTLMRLKTELGMALTASVTGLLLLISGSRVLRKYLATYPAPEEG